MTEITGRGGVTDTGKPIRWTAAGIPGATGIIEVPVEAFAETAATGGASGRIIGRGGITGSAAVEAGEGFLPAGVVAVSGAAALAEERTSATPVTAAARPAVVPVAAVDVTVVVPVVPGVFATADGDVDSRPTGSRPARDPLDTGPARARRTVTCAAGAMPERQRRAGAGTFGTFLAHFRRG